MAVKDSIQTNIETQLRNWETSLKQFRVKLDTLQSRAEELTGEAKLKYLEQIEGLEERINTTQHNLDQGKRQIEEMKGTAEDAWKDMKEGSQVAWEDLKAGMGNAWDELKLSMDMATKKLQDSGKEKK